jgi:hypothetical protein
VAVRPTVNDRNVAALGIALGIQAVMEGSQKLWVRIDTQIVEITDHRPDQLLCMHRYWRHCRSRETPR